MSDCCDSHPLNRPLAHAQCAERGTQVQLQTVKALLTEVALRRVQLTHNRFCGSRACDVVYFACDTQNPRGACCLGEIIAAVERNETAMLVDKED